MKMIFEAIKLLDDWDDQEMPVGVLLEESAGPMDFRTWVMTRALNVYHLHPRDA